MVQVVVGQFSNVQREVVFRRKDVIGLAVVIHIERHVARHLSALEVSLDEETLSHSAVPVGSPPRLKVVSIKRIHFAQCLGIKVHRPLAGIGSTGIEELIGAFGSVGNGHAKTGSIVAPSFQFEVEPHTELPRLRIVYHFRALQDTTTFNVMTLLVGHAEGHTTVAPIN